MIYRIRERLRYSKFQNFLCQGSIILAHLSVSLTPIRFGIVLLLVSWGRWLSPWYLGVEEPQEVVPKSELQRIIRIIRYSNSWDQIVLFVFGIRSICDFRIIFEYPNSCHQILNSSRIFYKKDMCRKHSKNLSCRYENKGSNFPHLIWSQNSHVKFLGGLLFDFKYSVFE